MASNTMNFGPEWMRRFPAKSNLSTDQHARAPSPPPSASHQDWSQPPNSATSATSAAAAIPAFSYSSIAASNVRSQNGASGQSSSYDASPSDGLNGSNTGVTSSLAPDSLNPFKYSKDLMLSLYRPTGLPIEFERHEYMTSEDSLPPISFLQLSEQEVKLLAGSVNSEVARRTAQPGDGPQERIQGQRRESFSNTGEHSAGRYDRSDKGTRTFESRSHGAGARPRNLNSEGRSHSFRRTEQIEREREREREPEDDGLWNSPVGNTVGSFDANGVFRVVGDGDELQPLSELEEPTSKNAEDDYEPTVNASSQPQEPVTFDQGPSNSDQSSPQQSHLQQPLQDKTGDSFLFSNATLTGNGSLREDAEFAPFNQSPNPSAATVPEPVFDSTPVELSKWLYRDPTGSIQGPFSSEEMHEWYKGGFFSPDLLIKREQDPTFEPLGSLIRKIGSEDKPFLLAGVIRQEPPAVLRPSIPSLAQNRQSGSQINLASGWVGMSAPSTPSTPSFGVDRHLTQQHQQHSSGDLFSSTNSLGQQRTGYGLEPTLGMPTESRWGANVFGGRAQNAEPAGGWGGDTFSRSSASGISAGHTPLDGTHFMDQQQRLHNQEIERQQFMQMLQRQGQMQAIMHQQQFMAAQQQFGNNPHALATLLAQQQAQQRQLQMRYQQLQYAGLHAQAVSTPGGTAIPWGGVGMGQPSSPWTTSIIPPNSDNYFDYSKGEGGQPSQQQQQQQQQQQRQNVPHSQMQHQQFQSLQQEQQLQQHHEEEEGVLVTEDHSLVHDPSSTAYGNAATDSLTERLESLEVDERSEKEPQHTTSTVEVELAIESVGQISTDEDKTDEPVYENEIETNSSLEIKNEDPREQEQEQEQEEQDQEQEFEQEHDHQEHESIEENISESTSWTATESWTATDSWTATESTPRTIKASPAPWAKPANADDDSSERKGPTLREIQEMEAKKAEEARAERQAQMAAAAANVGSNMLDFTKGMPGAPAWSSASSSTPKKKTLKEIQQEEEAAMKRARAAAASAAHQSGTTIAAPLGNQSTGLAAIVASGTGPVGRRYADTIGPKPAAVSVTTGPWGSASSPITGSKPALVTRSSAVFAANPSSNSPSNSAPRSSDNSWIEVGSKHSSSASSSPAVGRTTTTVAPTSSKPSTLSNSNEPRPASEEFLRWCRQALKDLQNVVLEDFIQMLLTFPLNPDPMTVEIISESIYANSKSLNGRQFADEFIKRRKADAYPNGAPASLNIGNTTSSSGAGAGGSDSSFKVVSKKGKKKGGA
ncbi:hypothetical protein BGZ49_003653 [Haplosporangium sp. Z 27]|nr:hypothetical protein BGZ49_003653 [Haplosporangium sp. Z 27]